MEVVVYSTVASAPGQVVVVTNENETIDSLISSFCTEKGIRHEKEYVIRNQKHQILPNARKLQTCQVENGDILYLGVRGMYAFNAFFPGGIAPTNIQNLVPPKTNQRPIP